MTELPTSRERNAMLPNFSRLPGKQSGLTLLELLIAMSLGMLLLVGIGTIFVGSNQTYRVQEQNARIQETGRYALEVIGRSIRQAGYTTCITTPPIQSCFAGAPIGGAANTITVQYDSGGGADCTGTVVAANALVTETYQLVGNDLQCTNGAATVPLVSNIQALQFLYGIDTNNDQSADQYAAAPGNWNQVVSARICVIARSEEQGIAIGNQSYLNCNGALNGTANFTVAGDTRLYRPFVATFNLRNRISNQP